MLSVVSTGETTERTAPLPSPRGELTEQLFAHLRRQQEMPGIWSQGAVDAVTDDELQLALYCCYELHYRSFSDVVADCEWDSSVLRVRRRLEHRLENDLRARVGNVVADPDEVGSELRRLARTEVGPSLSGWLARYGTLEHVRELAKHRSAYQLKEADPHTWAIPRLAGDAKAAMVAIQAAEYGSGTPELMHSSLFADTMRVLGLQPTPNAYLDELPGSTLTTTNLISFLGLHRRMRAALVGHLALFEMTSVEPMARYADTLARLGVVDDGLRFYEEHVEADVAHERLAIDRMVPALCRAEPHLSGDIVFGARALKAVEAEFATDLLEAWQAGRSSLRTA